MALTGYGIGGPIHGEVVRVPRFTLGTSPVDALVARLSLQKSGAYADPTVSGSIGTGILKRFRVAFDYPNRRIVLEPTRALDIADRFDAAGLWLGRGDGGFRVFDVIGASPAMEAGLRTGDVVTAIDGKPATTLDIFAARRILSDPQRTAIRLEWRRGAKTSTGEIALRDLLAGG